MSKDHRSSHTQEESATRSIRGKWPLFLIGALALCAALAAPIFAGGPMIPASNYRVLPPIVHGNLAIYPVVAGRSYDTSLLLTLDDGVRSGQVVISENGNQPGMVHPGQEIPVRPRGGAEVNRLVLYNNSAKPLLLLAGEIVTGGQQDRVISSDRIVPADSGPIDLSVFCVEPGRWTGAKPTFGSMGLQMAQPAVRAPAMAEQNQSAVWDNVRRSNANALAGLSAGAAQSVTVDAGSSYAKTFASPPVQKKIAEYGGDEGEHTTLEALRNAGANGVVVAVNGRILWADLFASTDLLAKYWPKLRSSYIAEAMTSANGGATPSVQDAEAWMNQLTGGREIAETEPGIFRRTDITGPGYRVLELTSLLPKTDFPVHVAKIREDDQARPRPLNGIIIR